MDEDGLSFFFLDSDVVFLLSEHFKWDFESTWFWWFDQNYIWSKMNCVGMILF